jgi:diguanylate cyclase (GGDEF)-like protein/PAS domain S-box-containing protein
LAALVDSREVAPSREAAPVTTVSGAFEAMAEAAARALGMPWASITILDGDRIDVKAAFGFTRTDGAVSATSFSASAGAADRFASAVAASGPASARMHAGVPIVAPDGTCLGALCVFDRKERPTTPGQLETLTALAGLAARQHDVHAALGQADAVRRELSTLIDASPLAISTLDPNGRALSWSPTAERLSGYAAADVVGRIPPWIPGGRNNRDFGEMLSSIRRGGTYLNQRSRRLRANGIHVDVRISAAPMFGDDGRVVGCVTIAENVEELERAERRLRLFESVVSRASDAVFVTSSLPLEDPEIVWVNGAFVEMYGYAAADVVGKPVSILHSTDSTPPPIREITQARRERSSFFGKILYRRKNGESFWGEASLSPVVEADGTCDNWVVIARDATEQQRAEQLQNDRGEILEMIAADAPMEDIFASLVATAERARPGASAVLRLRRDGRLHRVAFGPALRALDATIAVGDLEEPCGRAVAESRQIVEHGSGSEAIWSSPIRGGAGDILGTFAMYAKANVPLAMSDLKLGAEFARLAGLAMERHEDREQLEFLALHDPLTGLPNRKLYALRLDAAIAAAEKAGRHVALGMIDLDRFKVINDSLGHAVGDQLLRDVASRLARSLRPGDTIARLGGDEFVLLIDDLASRDDAVEIAERVLAALERSFDCDGHEIFVRASMGLSTYPADAADAAGLLAFGDAAMYESKARGRGEVGFHKRVDDRGGIARLDLETALNYALERREFELLFQPQVDVRSREMRGAEALIRWNHPTHGLMLPDTFIRAAEDTGLIVPIGAWVLEDACRLARQWQDEGLDRFVSVNVSPIQFERPEFARLVTQTLETTGLEAHRLHLELTESLVMRSPDKAASTLAELKALGIKIVIDDFGTGYSSFNYLKRFPLDALKIDRLFVRDIGFGSRASSDEAIVRAIVGVARALDLKIVAEGVENEDQAAFLRAIGVPLAQGFLFSPGLRPAALERWAQTNAFR